LFLQPLQELNVKLNKTNKTNAEKIVNALFMLSVLFMFFMLFILLPVRSVDVFFALSVFSILPEGQDVRV
jgi:hypothetical protein